MGAPEVADLELELLLEAIFQRYKYDFRGYARASQKRRMQGALAHFGVDTISQLQDRILRDPDLFATLLQFLTVPVTEMFRDPAYFAAFREKVVPYLRTYSSLKIWVAGCSTGEEPYSLAVLLDEEGLLERTLIYATDINPQSLQRAERGVYGLDGMKKNTANYQKSGGRRAFSDYYSSDRDGVRLDPRLRKSILFTDHSLATDHVFSEVQLVSCRNVLIYFDRPLQDRAIQLFAESLGNEGFLGVGEKESLRFSAFSGQFEPWAPESRIYRKKSPVRARAEAER